MLWFCLAAAQICLDEMDRRLLDYCIEAATAKSPAEKYEIVQRGLVAMDKKRYSRARADLIALSYGNLLLQDMPRTTKLDICKRLSKMDRLGFSIEPLLKMAEKFREETITAPVDHRYSYDLKRIKRDSEVVDELITALKARKTEGNSFSLQPLRLPGKVREIPK